MAQNEVGPTEVIPPERWARLDDYFGERMSLAERHEMDRWIGELPERRTIVAQAQTVWKQAGSASEPELPPVDMRAVLNKLAERRLEMDAAAPPHRRSTPPKLLGVAPDRNLKRGWRRPLAAAAAVLILATAVSLQLARKQENAKPNRLAAREVFTRPGELATLNLADGTRVILAAGSRLTIPADYNAPSAGRQLYLDGKAYFSVEHDSLRPFIVRTATAVTEDVGTEFVIKAYAELPVTEVVVVSGLVDLRGGDKAISSQRTRLRSGDIGRLDSAGRVSVEHGVALRSHVSWTQGTLAFNGVRLAEALADLSRLHNVDFVLRADSSGMTMDTLRVTGEFRRESIETVARRLELMLNVTATLSGRQVVLSRKGKTGSN
jgi:ferric-dicitrate binding protein FerR (iron transport regulator)